MKFRHQKFKKTLVFFAAIIGLIAILVILFISPITKYLIEKYDEKYTGRKITLGWAYVNPFTGYFYLSSVKIFELQSDSTMIYAPGISGNFSMLKLFGGQYELNDLTLDHPVGNIVQYKKEFSFSSFFNSFGSHDSDTTSSPGNFNIINIKISEGEFHYLQKEIPVSYFIKGANFEADGKIIDADTILFRFDFLSGPGAGSISGTYWVNFKNLDYRYDLKIDTFDLTPVEQYLRAIANYGTFRAIMDARLKATGNFSDAEDVTARGELVVRDFHVGKTRKEDYGSFDRLEFAIHELSPKNKKYVFDSVALIHPVIKYEQYEFLDNIQMMFGAEGANIAAAAGDPEKFNLIIEIARYAKELARNFFNSYYEIGKFTVDKADLRYNDFTLNEKFAVAVSPLSIRADSVKKIYKRTGIRFESGIKPYGNFTIDLSINPNDTGDFDMEYRFQKIPAALFNPYLVSFTSFPLDRGTIELNGKWEVRKGVIQSKNHLIVIDPRATKRIKNKNVKWIPLPLIMTFVRDYGNVIDFEIPIAGNLKNPKFNITDVLLDIIKNIFVKPVTTPYRMEVKNVEGEIEKTLALSWPMGQAALRHEQERFVGKISGFLEDNPQSSVTVHQLQYAAKEKEYILFYEAKKKYFLSANQIDAASFSKSDSESVCRMSIKDTMFVQYINRHLRDTFVFTMQEKCGQLISTAFVDEQFKKLVKEREIAFKSCFENENTLGRVKLLPTENTIPYNGFSFYKIVYNGELPNSLAKAYRKLQELNDEAPRKKYKRDEKKLR